MEPEPSSLAAIEDLQVRYARVVRHLFRRVSHYLDLYPTIPKKERVLGDCKVCAAKAVEIVCIGPKGPMCWPCHRPFSDLGLWTTIYPQPDRRVLSADNPRLVARLTGTQYSEAFAEALALAKSRREQIRNFRWELGLAEKRVAEAKALTESVPPKSDLRIEAAKRWSLAWRDMRRLQFRMERAENARRWFVGSKIRLRAMPPDPKTDSIPLPYIRRGVSVRFRRPAPHRVKSAEWFSRRLLQAANAGRTIYPTLAADDGEWVLTLPIRSQVEPYEPAGWLGVWPGPGHIALAAIRDGRQNPEALWCVPWGLAVDDLRRARAGWARHSARAVKFRAAGKRYRLRRKLRTTHTHVGRTSQTALHKIAVDIVAHAKALKLGLVLPTAWKAPNDPRPLTALLGSPRGKRQMGFVEYKARVAGVPVRFAKTRAADLSKCWRCGTPLGDSPAPQAKCPAPKCGRSLDLALHRAMWVARRGFERDGGAAPRRTARRGNRKRFPPRGGSSGDCSGSKSRDLSKIGGENDSGRPTDNALP